MRVYCLCGAANNEGIQDPGRAIHYPVDWDLMRYTIMGRDSASWISEAGRTQPWRWEWKVHDKLASVQQVYCVGFALFKL